MRSPSELDLVAWDAGSPVPFYAPAAVPAALRAVGAAVDATSSERAWNACLFGFGNNHRGELYRVAPEAAPFLVWYVAHGSRWARLTALEVLCDAAHFVGDAAVSVTDRGAGELTVEAAFRRRVAADADVVLAVLRDVSACEQMWVTALDLLDTLDACTDELRALFTSGEVEALQLTPLEGARVGGGIVAAAKAWLDAHA